MKNIFLVFLTSLTFYCKAQDYPIVYLDAISNVTSKDNAKYYRTVDKDGDLFNVKVYYIETDKLRMTAICSSINPKLVCEGEVIKYFENGEIEKIESYKEGKPAGLSKSYYSSGRQKSEVLYKEDATLYCQYWDVDGKPLLKEGTGVTHSIDEAYMEIQDSVLMASYVILETMDTIYYKAEKQAEYKGGLERFYSEIGKKMKGKYPRKARLYGIEGRVFVEFVVDENGNPVHGKVLKGIGAGCDELALNTVMSQKDWNPAEHKGKPVKVKMVLPIVFSLN